MKKSISKKIIQINVVMVLFALIFMAVVSTYTIKRYIQNDKAEDLFNELRLVRLFIADRYDAIISGEKIITNDRTTSRAARVEYESRTVLLIKNADNTWRQQRVNLNQISIPFQQTILSIDEIEEITSNMNLLKSGEETKQPFITRIGGEECLAVASPLPQNQIKNRNKQLNNIMVTYIPMTEINIIRNRIVRVMILSLLIGGGVSIIIGWLLSKRITKPIKHLKETAKKYAQRDFDQKAMVKTGDEIEDLAETINIMAQSIHQYDTHQKEFFQNISHELKTPLMSIQGYAEGIKEEMFEDEEQALNIIIDESKRIKKYVDDIILLSKLDTMEDLFDFQACSINTVIVKSIEKIESIAILNDIDIVYTPGEDAQIQLDQEKMIEVLINLLSNCLKYTKDTIEIETINNTDSFEIRIRDNGKGFGDKDLDKLFDRFYKGEKEGSGLGMSIVKKIIHGHKGEIIASNVKTGGAEFLIRLPI